MNMNNYGCISSETDLRDYKIKASAIQKEEYPISFEVSNMPLAKTQRKVCSCVAHATATILEHYADTKLSTNFIYGIKARLFLDYAKGMQLREALKIVYKYGDMLYTDCKGNTEVTDVFAIAEEAFDDIEKRERAAQFKIEGYAALKTSDEIKYALMHYGPVLASFDWYEDYKKENGDTVAEKIIVFNKSSAKNRHAVVIFGWNEHGWLIQNSWGITWCYKGKAVMPDDPKEAYSIIETGQDADDIVDPTRGDKIIELILKIISNIINLLKKK